MTKKEELLGTMYESVDRMNTAIIEGDTMVWEFEREYQKKLRKLFEVTYPALKGEACR